MGVYRAAYGGHPRNFIKMVEVIQLVQGIRILISLSDFQVVIFEAEEDAVAQKVANVFPKNEGFVYSHSTLKKFVPDGSAGCN